METKTKNWLTRQDVAEEFGVTARTVTSWITRGIVPAYKVGGATRIKASDLEALAQPIPAAAAR